jgi:hypothetical protein
MVGIIIGNDSCVGVGVLQGGGEGLDRGPREAGVVGEGVGAAERVPQPDRRGKAIRTKSILDKLANPSLLFARLAEGYNEIEKEMMASLSTLDDTLSHKKHRLPSNPSSQHPPQEDPHDDLDSYEGNHSQQHSQQRSVSSLRSNKRGL